MNTFLRTDDFDSWLSGLKDNVARARIVHRIRSAAYGNFGDCEPVGEGVSEMLIHVGPGYRAYYTRRGAVIYLLLLGGDKSSQKRDIKRAIEMVRCFSPPSATLRGLVAWRNSPRMRVLAVRASIRHSRPARSHAMTRCSTTSCPEREDLSNASPFVRLAAASADQPK